MTIFTIAPKKPLKEHLLPVFVTLGSVCLEVLVVKGEMHPLGHIVMDGSIKLEAETVP